MRIGLFHGYELTGSGSNEYVRYLSRALARRGHEVHVLCREPDPAAIPHVARAFAWDADGTARELFVRKAEGACTVHRLPHAGVRPVYLTDKQREGDVKAFVALTDEELRAYHELTTAVVRAVLARFPVDLLQANHLVWQPSVAAATGVPFVVFPHGSSIEYTVRADARYREAARDALRAARGLIAGNREVLDRILALYPDDRAALEAKSVIVGVGVDTALFKPVARADRAASVARLAGPFPGKTPEQEADLVARLDAGDYDALTGYRDAYDHGAPDADAAGKLARVPWDRARVLLFVGALTAGKGVQGLLAALPRVLARHPDTHLLIVGSGSYREVLEALVHALATGDAALFGHLRAHGFDLDRSELTGGWPDVAGPVGATPALAGRVHFLGRIDHARLCHVFPCADVAVFPSVVPEAYPLVLMESLANGVVPAVSDFSGFADGLRTLEALLGSDLVDRMRLPVDPATRVAGIADRLDALLDAVPFDTKRLREIAVRHFDWDVRAREMTEAYHRFV